MQTNGRGRVKERFTQQKWVVADGTKVAEQVLFVHAPEIGGVICRLTHIANPSIPLSEADIANAHLIATAPKMYAEIEQDIQNLYQYLCDIDSNSLQYAAVEKKIERKQKLLAEARGEL